MRFYVSPESIFTDKNLIEISDKSEVHHIRDVMRLREGVKVNIFDGRGKEYSGEIKKIDRNLVLIKITKANTWRKELPYNITLYQAIPKRAKMDFIIEKAVELGVNKITPIITERTAPIVKDKSRIKVERWSRIARAASKQCGRMGLPIISDVTDFDDALVESKKNDLVIFAALDNDAKPLRSILRNAVSKNIAVFVGPEGDFSSKEILMAKEEEDYRISSLGPSILRSETAAIYILSCISYEYAPVK
jgi:16S rRNA (uracil1498-N3)-methyltransferase